MTEGEQKVRAALSAAMLDDGTIYRLAESLGNPSRSAYENLRTQLIAEKGYDTFRELQNYAFVIALGIDKIMRGDGCVPKSKR